MPSVREYIERKERAIREIQAGVQEKEAELAAGVQEIARGIAEKADAMALGVQELQQRAKEFEKEYYGY